MSNLTRPETVQEAMQSVSELQDAFAHHFGAEPIKAEKALFDLAAYVRELEAERDGLQKIIDDDPCLFTRMLSEDDILKAFDERDRLKSELAEARSKLKELKVHQVENSIIR